VLLIVIRAVHRDDVGVADAREISRLGQRSGAGGLLRQQLDRDLALDLRVPRAVDPSERAGADRFEEYEVSPARG